MLAEFVAKLQEMAIEGSGTEVKHIKGDHRAVLIDGQRKELPPPPEENVFEDVASLVRWSESIDGVELYHDADHIVGVADDRLAFSKVALRTTPTWERLKGLGSGTAFSVKSLMRFLRYQIGGGHVPEGAITTLSKITFERETVAGATVRHGEQSLGRSVESKVRDALDIPEMLAVRNVPIFVGFPIKVDIPLHVHLDTENENIELIPAAGAIEEAFHYATAEVGDHLRKFFPEDAQPPIFFGTPTSVYAEARART